MVESIFQLAFSHYVKYSNCHFENTVEDEVEFIETILERTTLEMIVIANHKGNKVKMCVIWHPKG